MQNRSWERSVKFRMRTSPPIHSQVRFAAQTSPSEPQMFSHSETSQESQVVMKHILIDSVLSLHHFAFKPQNKEEKPVRAAEKNLGAEMWNKSI